jgi:O-antigen/teichoic acid export membrane protein
MRAHLSNAAYGVLDYVAWPAGMLIVAPIALHHLGSGEFGVWMIANAALTIGSIVASGFGDANIRSVSQARGSGDITALGRAVRGTMGIHLVMGVVVAAIAWALAPLAAERIAIVDAGLQAACLWSLRIASVLILIRAIETVCVSTQRAFERYGAAVSASVVGRLLALASAAVLPLAGIGVFGIMAATAIFLALALALQLFQLSRLLGPGVLAPSFDRDALTALLGFGVFTWLQAVAGVAFAQADRLITGMYLGAATVALYALCAQLAQPIYGMAAAGLHFLFPYVSARTAPDSLQRVRRAIVVAFAANLLVVATGACVLLFFGGRLLSAWVGSSVAQAGAPVLPPLVWSTAAQGLSITGTYTLLALGRVRWVTFLNLAGGAAMLLAAPLLVPRFGAQGMATARLFYGPFTLLVYVPLLLLLFGGTCATFRARAAVAACEEAGQ